MPIIAILQPKPVPRYTAGDHHTKTNPDSSSSSDSDSEASDGGGADLEGDIAMAIKAESRKRPAAAAVAANSNKRARDYGSDIVTPGKVITDDPQWMRFVLFLFLLLFC